MYRHFLVRADRVFMSCPDLAVALPSLLHLSHFICKLESSFGLRGRAVPSTSCIAANVRRFRTVKDTKYGYLCFDNESFQASTVMFKLDRKVRQVGPIDQGLLVHGRVGWCVLRVVILLCVWVHTIVPSVELRSQSSSVVVLIPCLRRIRVIFRCAWVGDWR